MERKIIYIDVSKMSLKEANELLSIKYEPWYKVPLFWLIVGVITLPFLVNIAAIVICK